MRANGTRRTVIGALCVVLIVAAADSPLTTQEGPAAPADSFADYPPFESWAWNFVHQPALAKEKAIRLLSRVPGSPEAAEAFLGTVSFVDGPSRWTSDGLAAVRTAVEQHPSGIPGILSRLVRAIPLLGPDHGESVRAILLAARRNLAGLPREQAADAASAALRVEFYLDRADATRQKDALLALARDYDGTRAAALARLDLVAIDTPAERGDRTRQIAALDTFVREHAGTCVAAAALRRQAWALGRQAWALGHPSSGSGGDPAPAFLRVMDIVRQLDAPPYSACPHDALADPEGESVRLVAGLHVYKPAYAPGSVDRLLDAYGAFVASRFGPHVNDLDNGLGYIIFSKMGELYETRGDRAGGVDRFLSLLETTPANTDHARFLRAVALLPHPMRVSPKPGPPPAFPDAAATMLRELRSAGGEGVARKALATLAWLNQYEGRLDEARGLYRTFVERYPRSGFAWLAAVRAGQCAAELGDLKGAAESYLAAARFPQSMPLAPVLGNAYAARASETLGQPAVSLAQYRTALAAWDARYGRYLSLRAPRRPIQAPWPSMARLEDESSLNRESLMRRSAELVRTTAAPGAEAVERARWLVDHGRAEEGMRALDGFEARYPGSANAADAAYLAHKGRLFAALARLTDPGQATRIEGERALGALAGEPFDFPVCAAAVARALLLKQRGEGDEADRVARAALEQWRAGQQFQEPDGPVARDVAEIRRALFQPLGGALLGKERWNAFVWPGSLPAFLVVGADLTLGFADDRREPFSLAQRYPAHDNVLVVTAEQIGILGKVMDALGGTAAREGQVFIDKGVMEPPVVPVGRSLNAINFLAGFFEARPGHWGGWEFLTYPVITEIVFTNDARTAAVARIVVGYSGCSVALEKVDGTWTAVRLTNRWVT